MSVLNTGTLMLLEKEQVHSSVCYIVRLSQIHTHVFSFSGDCHRIATNLWGFSEPCRANECTGK